MGDESEMGMYKNAVISMSHGRRAKYAQFHPAKEIKMKNKNDY